MNTEITDNEKIKAWVLFDADCRICNTGASRFEQVLARRRFALMPLQTPWVRQRLNLPGAELLAEVRLLFTDGRLLGGADAIVFVARRIWWSWPLWAISRIPGAMLLLRRGYRWFAQNRYCIGGRCQIAPERRRSPSGADADGKSGRDTNGLSHSDVPRAGAGRGPAVWLDYLPFVVLPTLGLSLVYAWAAFGGGTP